MEHKATWVLLLVGLFVLLSALVETGRWLRRRAVRRTPTLEAKGFGTIEAAIFSLLGLLLAFSFTHAASRFDDRRELAVSEANALGTAYLRLDLTPPPVRDELKARFRDYVDARIAGYRALPDAAVATRHFDHATDLQRPIWTLALDGSAQVVDSRAAILVLPALNTCFDIANSRTAAFFIHPPPVVFGLLLALSMFCAVLTGWSMGETPLRSRLHAFGFVLSLGLTLYLTVDMELPRYGLVTVARFDSVLVDARARME